MVLGRLRKSYERIMMPMGRVLSQIGLTPNSITVISVLVSVVACYFFFIQNLILGVIFTVLTGVVDMFDGAIARATNGGTRFGAVFDHVLDRYAEYFIIFGIILGGYIDWWIGLFTLFSMIMASFTRAKAESVGGLKSCTVGVAERQEKLLLIIGGAILTYYFPSIVFLNFNIFSIAILLVGILSQITVIQRFNYTWKHQGKSER